MPEEQRVRLATETDLQDIFEIASVCPEAPQWSFEQYGDMLKDRPNSLQQRALLVADVGDQIAGFAVASSVAGEAELESVAVAPMLRRIGVGKKLCEALIMWAKAQEVTIMLLEVRATNVTAQFLYEQLGFTKSGVRKNYYSAPVEDAVLMTATL